ncbi:MAG: Crp/Fnr family transcriptional regulator [Acidobacteria bacterium]|nr:MAG: Crp/Fnr family transcriptional regulator [Acidobacteriota bacterium]
METGKSRFAKRTGSVRPDGFTDAAGNPVKNALLLAIPDREFGLLRPHLEYLELPHHQILQEPGQKIEYAYFLNHGMISLVILTSDGRSVEVAIVGNEGMVGTSLAVGLNRGPHRAIIQISASGFRVKSELLGEVLSRTPELRLIMNRYVLIQGLQVAQIAACNRLHEVEQRLARWLLMCQDRIGSEEFPMTHEFLAQMLGTGRPSVSLAAGILQRAGMIENIRGTVKIVNRKGLEGSSCECYAAMRQFSANMGI